MDQQERKWEEVADPELAPLWKPEEDGEQVQGVVGGVRVLKFEGSKALKLQTGDGAFMIPITGSLKDVPWERLKGYEARIKFEGWVETKGKGDDGLPRRVRKLRAWVRPAADVTPF